MIFANLPYDMSMMYPSTGMANIYVRVPVIPAGITIRINVECNLTACLLIRQQKRAVRIRFGHNELYSSKHGEFNLHDPDGRTFTCSRNA